MTRILEALCGPCVVIAAASMAAIILKLIEA